MRRLQSLAPFATFVLLAGTLAGCTAGIEEPPAPDPWVGTVVYEATNSSLHVTVEPVTAADGLWRVQPFLALTAHVNITGPEPAEILIRHLVDDEFKQVRMDWPCPEGMDCGGGVVSWSVEGLPAPWGYGWLHRAGEWTTAFGLEASLNVTARSATYSDPHPLQEAWAPIDTTLEYGAHGWWPDRIQIDRPGLRDFKYDFVRARGEVKDLDLGIRPTPRTPLTPLSGFEHFPGEDQPILGLNVSVTEAIQQLGKEDERFVEDQEGACWSIISVRPKAGYGGNIGEVDVFYSENHGFHFYLFPSSKMPWVEWGWRYSESPLQANQSERTVHDPNESWLVGPACAAQKERAGMTLQAFVAAVSSIEIPGASAKPETAGVTWALPTGSAHLGPTAGITYEATWKPEGDPEAYVPPAIRAWPAFGAVRDARLPVEALEALDAGRLTYPALPGRT